MQIESASSANAWVAVRRLVADYLREFHPDGELDVNDRARLADLQRTYTQPGAAMLIAFDGGSEQGCCGLVPQSPLVAEVKRLFVVPSARRRGVATRLLREIAVVARDLGYQRLQLDVVGSSRPAIALYQKLGWHPIDHWEGRTDMAAFEHPLR